MTELSWASQPAGAEVKTTVHPKTPDAWLPEPDKKLQRERMTELEFARRTLAAKLREKNKAVETALFEMEQQQRGSLKMLGTLCDGTLGNLQRLVDLFEDPGVGLWEQRRAAAFALQAYIAREPGNDVKLFEELKTRKEYGEDGARLALVWMRDFSEEDRNSVETYRALVDGLKASRVGLRELAGWRLAQADPKSGIPYNAGNDQMRERWFQEWKRRLDDGALPPKPSAPPQGQLPAKAPPRG
jgi:hypothetical protein